MLWCCVCEVCEVVLHVWCCACEVVLWCCACDVVLWCSACARKQGPWGPLPPSYCHRGALPPPPPPPHLYSVRSIHHPKIYVRSSAYRHIYLYPPPLNTLLHTWWWHRASEVVLWCYACCGAYCVVLWCYACCGAYCVVLWCCVILCSAKPCYGAVFVKHVK